MIYAVHQVLGICEVLSILAATCQRHIPTIFIICKKCMFVVSFMHELVLLYVYFNILLHIYIYIYIYTRDKQEKIN